MDSLRIRGDGVPMLRALKEVHVAEVAQVAKRCIVQVPRSEHLAALGASRGTDGGWPSPSSAPCGMDG
jgi:hypothetical protein